MTKRQSSVIGPDGRDVLAALTLLRGLSRANARDLASRSIWVVRKLIAAKQFPFHWFSEERRQSLLRGVAPGVLKMALNWRALGQS